jgi:hypothetical protein
LAKSPGSPSTDASTSTRSCAPASAAPCTAAWRRSCSSSGPTGTFLKEIGKDLYGFAFAHTVRIDADGNLWATDEGHEHGDEVQSRRESADGVGPPRRSGGSSAGDAAGSAIRGRSGAVSIADDVTWDKAGNIFIADGYNNSRVVKVDKNGRG